MNLRCEKRERIVYNWQKSPAHDSERHSVFQHFSAFAAAEADRPSLVSIGVFDGVHRGHQYLIQQLVDEAQRRQQRAVIVTFFPHPDVVLRGISGRYYLTTPEYRAELLGRLGVEAVITLPFDDRLRHQRAAAFVDELLTHLKLSSLWITADFALGYQREGDFAFLSAQGQAKGFEVHPVDLLMQNGGEVIRSSAIREVLQHGEVDRAERLLGRHYHVSGEVVHGDQRGRTIGFPTANLAVWDELVLPANGVYAGWALLNGEKFAAVTNIGVRPTFDGVQTRVEAHLLDFDRDIYGQTLAFDFVARLRGEQKFSGIEALVAQIRTDVEQGRKLLGA